MHVPELAPEHASRRQRHSWQRTPPACGRPAPSVGADGCSRAASRYSFRRASARLKNTSTFRHSSRGLPLKLSM